MVKLKNNKQGWVIAERYIYKKEYRYNPIGKVYMDGSYSGYIYVYSTKKCASLALARLQMNFRNMCIVKCNVKILEGSDGKRKGD